MKIINKVDTAAWSYKIDCARCETELEVERGDLHTQHYPGDCRGESAYDKFFCYCPVCKGQINILNDKIPKAVQVEVLQKKSSSTSYDYTAGPFEDFYNK